MKLKTHVFFNFLIFTLIVSACGPSKLKKTVYEQPQTSSIPDYLKVIKVHMKNGELFVLSHWELDNSEKTVNGKGSHFDADRNEILTDAQFSIPISNIALFEGNAIDNNGQTGQIVSMSAVSFLNLFLSVYCASDPKACFGSCPTYYAHNGRELSLQGEGFSSSMAKVYEAKDLDMLYDAHNQSDTFKLEIRNEALETHMIRFCDLIVIPKDETEKIYASSDYRFYASSKTDQPELCRGNEGDILYQVKEYDKIERYSKADSFNLMKKEFIDLIFKNNHKDYGLVLTSRQTLMTTYLFYQTMAYFGNTLPYWTTKLENGNRILKNKGLNMYDRLGGIEIFIKTKKNTWKKIEEIQEMGPIASDFHLIKLPEIPGDKIHIRLKMTQGLWRIDYLSLAELDYEVFPIRIKPNRLVKQGFDQQKSLKVLNDTSEYLVTLPGEKYIAYYNLPQNESLFEYYLLSKGYYLEWMREEWLKEENKKMMTLLFMRPNKYLKEMAPKFKKVEPIIENFFWRTKIQTH